MWKEVAKSLLGGVFGGERLPETISAVLLTDLMSMYIGGEVIEELSVLTRLIVVIENKGENQEVKKARAAINEKGRELLGIVPSKGNYSMMLNKSTDETKLDSSTKPVLLADSERSSRTRTSQSTRRGLNDPESNAWQIMSKYESNLKAEMITTLMHLKTHCRLASLKTLNDASSYIEMEESRCMSGIDHEDFSCIQPPPSDDRSFLSREQSRLLPLAEDIEEFLKYEEETRKLIASVKQHDDSSFASCTSSKKGPATAGGAIRTRKPSQDSGKKPPAAPVGKAITKEISLRVKK